MRILRKAVSSVILAAGCLAVTALVTHAQAAAPAPVSWAQLTPGTDWSAQIINDLFPVGNPGATQAGLAGEQTAIGTMIGYLNGFVLLLAMAFVAYATIIEVHRGAETGRVLSERTSSWAPIRMGFAAIMMVPLAGGFTVGQAGVIKVALWGVGMARMVYDAGIDAIGSQGLPVTTPQIPNTEPIVAALINNELCMALINAAAGNLKVILPPVPVASTTPTGGIQIWNYALNGNQTGAPTCGSVKLKEANSAGTSFDGVNISMAGPQLADINYLIATSIRPAVQQVAANFWQDRSTADLQPLWGILVNATNAYTQMLTQNATQITQQLNAAKATSGSLDTTTTQMKDLGWAGAGAYFWKIAQINGETLSYLNVTPTVMPPSYRGLGPALTSDLTPLVNAVTAFNREIYQLALTNDSTNAPTGLSDRPPKDKSGLMSYAFNLMHLNQVVLNNMVALISPTANSWTNPFTSMVGLGDTMIAASMTGYGTVAALNAATSRGLWAKLGRITPIGAASAAAGKVLNTGVLGKLIFWMLAALLVPGLLLAFVIPMIPLTMWLAGVASWFILVIEAIIAVPLWMFAHMSYQGEGFHGRAEHGYSLLFNVLFRPVLMLFGLMLGYWLFTIMSWLTFLTYSLATDFVLQQGYLVVNFFGVIVLTCMLVSIEMAWEVMAFRLISQIPYQVVQWIGFKPASRVDMENFAQETTTQGSREVLAWSNRTTQTLLGSQSEGGGYSPLSYGGGSSYNPPRLTGPGGGPRGNGGGGGAAAHTDSTLSAASTVVPPASPQPAEGG